MSSRLRRDRGRNSTATFFVCVLPMNIYSCNNKFAFQTTQFAIRRVSLHRIVCVYLSSPQYRRRRCPVYNTSDSTRGSISPAAVSASAYTSDVSKFSNKSHDRVRITESFYYCVFIYLYKKVYLYLGAFGPAITGDIICTRGH